MLTEQDSVKIYESKIRWKEELRSGHTVRSIRGQSVPLSKLYGVSSRAIRDIWNRQTWAKATQHLWGKESALDTVTIFPVRQRDCEISVG